MSDKILEKLGEIQSSISEIATNQKNNYRAIQENRSVLKEQASTLKEQEKTLTRLTGTVEVHEMRSTNLELDLKNTKIRFHEDMNGLRDDIEPIKTHVQQVSGAGKLVRWISYIAGSILAVSGLVALIQKYL